MLFGKHNPRTMYINKIYQTYFIQNSIICFFVCVFFNQKFILHEKHFVTKTYEQLFGLFIQTSIPKKLYIHVLKKING